MKKFFLLLFTSIIIITSTGLNVFCDDAYVPSISIRNNIGVEGGEIDPETGAAVIWDWCDDCHRKLVITPYYLKDTIESEESKEEIEIAYQLIIETDSVASLCEDVIEIAHSLGVKEEDLVIRDLFDITPYNCELQNNVVELTLTTEQLDNFVCLLHYNGVEFEVVPDAYVTIDGCHLYIKVDDLSPFAIVLATDYGYIADDDGGKTGKCIWHWFMLLTLLVTLILVQIIRKKDDEEEKEEDNEKKVKKIIRRRNIISVISLILSIIFFILGSCKLDLYVLIAEIVVLLVVLYYTYHNKDEETDE